MERQTQGDATFPPFIQKLIDQSELKGELKGERELLLRLMAKAGIALTDEERARIQGCEDDETLLRWAENIIGAKTAADVFS